MENKYCEKFCKNISRKGKGFELKFVLKKVNTQKSPKPQKLVFC